MPDETWVEYRILSQTPTDKVWRFRGFSRSKSASLEQALANLAHVRGSSPGWKFKLQSRTVRQIMEDWADTDETGRQA